MVASVTETESPWADPDQALQMQALEVFEANLCPNCGRPVDICSDPDLAVMVDDRVCMFGRAVDVARHWDDSNHAKDKRTKGVPFWSDGLVYVPRTMTEAESNATRPAPLLVVGGTDTQLDALGDDGDEHRGPAD